MRFWSNNPELYDEITVNALPEFYKNAIESGIVWRRESQPQLAINSTTGRNFVCMEFLQLDLDDVPEKIRYKAAIEGEREFWADRADEAKLRQKK